MIIAGKGRRENRVRRRLDLRRGVPIRAARDETPRGGRETAAGRFVLGSSLKIPAMTDFRAEGTIMGPAGLTAVFGMGTGVTPPVWSPGNRPGGGETTRARCKPEFGHVVSPG